MECNIELERNRLYSRSVSFKNFNGISEEDLTNIEKLAEKFSDNLKVSNIAKLDKYIRTLLYLNSLNSSRSLTSFDKKMIFMIKTLDPDLTVYKMFLASDILSLGEIKKITNPDEKRKATAFRNAQIGTLASRIRAIFGWYDPNVLNYEAKYFTKFISQKELVQGIENDYLNDVVSKLNDVEDFDSITDERLEALNEKAMEWISVMGDKANYKNLCFHLLYQTSLLGVRTHNEAAAFMVLALDGNLEVFDCFMNGSRWDEIEEAVKSLVGFYNPRIIDFERYYAEKFQKEKLLDPWGLTKKSELD